MGHAMISHNGGIVHCIVTAFHDPLVVMNVLGLWITRSSVLTGTKDMNFTVVSTTHNLDQGFFPFVVSLRANRID
jgi:hypothetical protein